MTSEALLQKFDALAAAPNGVQKLREMILQLAVRGKLVPQDPSEEPASVLLKRIEEEKQRLFESGEIRKPKKLPPVLPEDTPHSVPDSWVWTRLGVIVDYNGRPKVRPKDIPVDAWVLELVDIEKESSRIVQRLTHKQRQSRSTKTSFQAGDVLYGKLRPYLNKVVVADQPGYCSTEIVPLRPTSFVDGTYLLHALKSPDFITYVNSRSYGMDMPRLGTKDGELAPIPLPPLPEQHRIVERVDQLMALCDELEERQHRRTETRVSTNRSALHHLTTAADNTELAVHWRRIREHFDTLYDAPETLAELRQAVLQLAVRGKLVPQDLSDEPASVLLKRIEEEKQRLYEAGEIRKPKKLPPVTEDEVPFAVPKGWEWVRFGRITLDIGAGWSPKCEPQPRQGDAWGVIKISSVSWGRFNPQENKALPSNLTPRSEYEVRPGDFLISRANTAELVGRSVVVEDTPPHLLLNDKTLRVRVPDHIDRHYLNLYNNSRVTREYYAATASGTSSSMRNLSRIQILSLAVALPPLEEQRRIVAKVDQLMALCDELEAALTHSRTKAERLAASVVHHMSAA